MCRNVKILEKELDEISSFFKIRSTKNVTHWLTSCTSLTSCELCGIFSDVMCILWNFLWRHVNFVKFSLTSCEFCGIFSDILWILWNFLWRHVNSVKFSLTSCEFCEIFSDVMWILWNFLWSHVNFVRFYSKNKVDLFFSLNLKSDFHANREKVFWSLLLVLRFTAASGRQLIVQIQINMWQSPVTMVTELLVHVGAFRSTGF